MTTKNKSTDSSIKPIKQIAWATDFSKESRFCLPYVKFFTKTLNTKNHALYVLPKFSDWILETAFLTDDELFKTIERTRNKSISTIKGFAKKAEIPLEPVVLDGFASVEVINYSNKNNIDIVFAGRRGVSEIEQILIGSTTSRLIRNTEVPVFVVPKNKRAVDIKTILCPIDFNEFSLKELKYAISLSQQLKAKLYVVHISEFFNYQVPVFKRDKLIEKINHRIMSIAEDHNYQIEKIIYDEGEPGQKIIEISKKIKADVITMATHQRKGIEKFFLGSITEKVLMYSNIPVMVLPPAE